MKIWSKLLNLLVPGAGVEPARPLGSRDFKSLRSPFKPRALLNYKVFFGNIGNCSEQKPAQKPAQSIAMVGLLLAANAQAQEIYTFTGYGTPDADKIKRAAWDLSERVGGDFHYVGVVPVGHMPNAITIRIGSYAEWGNRTADALAAQPIDGDVGCQIVINPLYNILFKLDVGLMTHELAHCAGAWGHSSDKADILYPTSGNYGMTQNDALMVMKSPTWPAVKPPSLCHAAIDADWNLSIVEIGGYRARLKYADNNRWVVVASGIDPTPQGCTDFKIEGGRAILPDVRGYPDLRYSAVLECVAGGWKLVSAQE